MDIVDDIELEECATGHPSELFTGLDWLKLPIKQQDSSARRFALKPLSSNTATAAAGVNTQQKSATVSKVHARQPRAAQALQQNQLPPARSNNTSAQHAGSLLALSTKPAPPAAGQRTGPSSKLLCQQDNIFMPAQHELFAAASVLNDSPANESDEGSEELEAAERRLQLSKLQQHKAARASSHSSKQTALQQQHTTFQLPSELFSAASSRAGTHQQQQQQQQDLPKQKPTVTFSRAASKRLAATGEVSVTPADNPASAAAPSWLLPLGTVGGSKPGAFAGTSAAAASKRGRHCSSKAASIVASPLSDISRPITASKTHLASMSQQPHSSTLLALRLPGLDALRTPASTAAPGMAAKPALPPLKPLAAAAAPKASTGAAAGTGTNKSAALSGLGLGFNTTSTEGELELVMLSPKAAPFYAQHRGTESDASLGSRQQHCWQHEQERQGQQSGSRAAAKTTLQFGAGKQQGNIPNDHQQQQQQQQQQRWQQPQAAAKQLQSASGSVFAGDSQVSGSEGAGSQDRVVPYPEVAETAAKGGRRSASLSYAESASESDVGSESDAEFAASPSSGSLWSGDCGSASGSSGRNGSTGSDSDVSFVTERRKRKQTAPGCRTGAGATPRKLMSTGEAAGAGKARKVVRFANDEGVLPVAASAGSNQQQQQAHLQEGRSNLKASSKAAGSAAALDLEAVLPGEAPLLLPPARTLTRSGVVLVELPAGFDAEGDAGAIGRVLCNPAKADTEAAVARVASRLGNRQPQARKAAGHSDDVISLESLNADSDVADASQSCSQGSDSFAGPDNEKQPAGLPALDLKGTVYNIQELMLAGTAAVVRINAPGKGASGRPASAHMEHLLGSFLRATPSAAAAAAEQDGHEAYEYDWEADEDPYGDSMVCSAAAAGCGGDGEGAPGAKPVGHGKGRGRGRGKRSYSRGGSAGRTVGTFGAGRTGTGQGARGSKRGGMGAGKKKGTGRKQAVRGGRAKGGAAAACSAKSMEAAGTAVAAVKTSAGKTIKKDPWETDTDASD